MKRSIVLIIIIFLCTLLFSKPVIEFETLEHDFGRIKEEAGPYEVDFNFTNTGDEPFHLVKVKAGWGCTAPSWSTGEIQPGQTGTISVEFDSNNRPGSFGKSIKVNTSIDKKITKLIIKGFVIATPGKLRKKIGYLDSDMNSVDFGDILMGSILSQKIKIHNTTKDTIYISYPKENIGIQLEIDPYKLPPAAYGELVLHFDTKKQKFGTISDVIFLNTGISDQVKSGKIKIRANIIEDFSTLSAEELAASPQIFVQNETIILDDLKPGVLKTEKIVIENNGLRDLYIRNIQTYSKEFNIEPTELIINPGKKASFGLSIKPENYALKLKTSISIVSNDPKRSIIKLTVLGEVNIPESDKARSVINEISIEKAKFILKSFKGQEDFVILDVRTEEEYNSGCIEGAVNLDVEKPDFTKMLKLFDTEKIYLVYCKSGYRSRKAIELMNKINFTQIYHMFEGIDGWKAEHLELKEPNAIADK